MDSVWVFLFCFDVENMANATFNRLVAAVNSLLCWAIKKHACLIVEIMEEFTE